MSLHLRCSDSTGSGRTWPSRFGAGWLLSGQPGSTAMRSPQGASFPWLFHGWEIKELEVWSRGNSGTAHSPAGTQDPGMHSLPRSSRARSVCLQGTVKTHLFTGACFWVVALWQLPSPTSQPGWQQHHLIIFATSSGGAGAGKELFYNKARQPKDSDSYLFCVADGKHFIWMVAIKSKTTKRHVSNSELFIKPIIILLFIKYYSSLFIAHWGTSAGFFFLLALCELGEKIWHLNKVLIFASKMIRDNVFWVLYVSSHYSHKVTFLFVPLLNCV